MLSDGCDEEDGLVCHSQLQELSNLLDSEFHIETDGLWASTRNDFQNLEQRIKFSVFHSVKIRYEKAAYIVEQHASCRHKNEAIHSNKHSLAR